MAHASHVDISAGFDFGGLQVKLKSFAKTLFLKLVDSRMATAKQRIAAMRP